MKHLKNLARLRLLINAPKRADSIDPIITIGSKRRKEA